MEIGMFEKKRIKFLEHNNNNNNKHICKAP